VGAEPLSAEENGNGAKMKTGEEKQFRRWDEASHRGKVNSEWELGDDHSEAIRAGLNQILW